MWHRRFLACWLAARWCSTHLHDWQVGSSFMPDSMELDNTGRDDEVVDGGEPEVENAREGGEEFEDGDENFDPFESGNPNRRPIDSSGYEIHRLGEPPFNSDNDSSDYYESNTDDAYTSDPEEIWERDRRRQILHEEFERSRGSSGAAPVEQKGLPSHIIASLPSSSHVSGQSAISGSDELCMICCGKYKAGDNLGTLPCKHKYHKDCIGKWLRINKVCHLCKALVVGGAENDKPT